MNDDEYIDVVLALCELISEFDRIEGRLLTAGGENKTISPKWLAQGTKFSEEVCEKVLLQLRRINAVERLQEENPRYSINPSLVRDCFSMSRRASRIIEHHQSRLPEQTNVKPLVTLPADPAFRETTANDFDMAWLMPSLGRLLKHADESIVLLTPFFDEEGFQQFHQPLQNALSEGINVTVITRYLLDTDSHNRSVMEKFVEESRDKNISLQTLSLVDYTVWDEDTESDQKSQDGANPAFTLHAKLLLVDDERAYLGSANVTDYGFDRYLEIGAILDGPSVKSYSKLIEFLLTSDAATVCTI